MIYTLNRIAIVITIGYGLVLIVGGLIVKESFFVLTGVLALLLVIIHLSAMSKKQEP